MRFFLSLLFVFLLSFSFALGESAQAPCESTCRDTDSNPVIDITSSYFVSGYVYNPGASQITIAADACSANGVTLTERRCGMQNTNDCTGVLVPRAAQTYDCPYGCITEEIAVPQQGGTTFSARCLQASESSCTDSDPTPDPALFGIVEIGPVTYEDTCLLLKNSSEGPFLPGDAVVVEYSCPQELSDPPLEQQTLCPNGCADGVCLAGQDICPQQRCLTAGAMEYYTFDSSTSLCAAQQVPCPLGCYPLGEDADGSCRTYIKTGVQGQPMDTTGVDPFIKNTYSVWDLYNSARPFSDLCINGNTQVKQFHYEQTSDSLPYRIPFPKSLGVGSSPLGKITGQVFVNTQSSSLTVACSSDYTQLVVTDDGQTQRYDCPLGCADGTFTQYANCIGGYTDVVSCAAGCVNGACRDPESVACTTAADCADAAHTGTASCEQFSCTYSCTSAAQCTSDELCVSGSCVAQCSADADCALGAYCSSAGACLSQECTSDSACAVVSATEPSCDLTTYACVACVNDAQCGANQQCENNLCVATFTPTADTDNDGVMNQFDVCPAVANPVQTDTDHDGIGDTCDLCPLTATGATVAATGCATGQSATPAALATSAEESCSALGGIDCGTDTCVGTPTPTWDADGCCVGAAATCSVSLWSPSAAEIVTWTYGDCVDPDGDGVGSQEVCSDAVQEGCQSEACTVLPAGGLVPFSSLVALFGAFVLLALFYGVRRKL